MLLERQKKRAVIGLYSQLPTVTFRMSDSPIWEMSGATVQVWFILNMWVA